MTDILSLIGIQISRGYTTAELSSKDAGQKITTISK